MNGRDFAQARTNYSQRRQQGICFGLRARTPARQYRRYSAAVGFWDWSQALLLVCYETVSLTPLCFYGAIFGITGNVELLFVLCRVSGWFRSNPLKNKGAEAPFSA